MDRPGPGVAIVGDRDETKGTHPLRELALGHAGVCFEWVPTSRVGDSEEYLASAKGGSVRVSWAGSRSQPLAPSPRPP